MFFEKALFCAILSIWIFKAGEVSAFQEHGALEGLVVHQGAHLLFFLAMCDFSYRLLKAELLAPLSRKYLLAGALLLALWNLWAFIGHVVASNVTRFPLANESRNALLGWWHINDSVELFYYILKMDDLLLVPAIFFFFLASRRIMNEMD